MRYWLVMPAAGAGRRFGAPVPKQYATLAGRTVIEWALEPFLADRRCAEVVVALAPNDGGWEGIARRLASRASMERHFVGPPRASVTVVTGGTQRSHSVRSALAGLERRAGVLDWVLVHDAVRPCLDAGDLERLLAALAAHPLGGLLAVPAADTLKRADTMAQPDTGTRSADALRAQGAYPPPEAASQPLVTGTVERTGLWRALTPQMFRYGRLCEALDEAHAAGRYPTDEAQALEWLGEHPVLVEGAVSNIKITTARDLVLAEAILGSRVERAEAFAQPSE